MSATQQQLASFEKILKALANKRRLTILQTIKQRPGISVSEIAKTIRLSIKATSKHLCLLSNAHILEKEQQGLLVFYYLKKERLPCSQETISYL